MHYCTLFVSCVSLYRYRDAKILIYFQYKIILLIIFQ